MSKGRQYIVWLLLVCFAYVYLSHNLSCFSCCFSVLLQPVPVQTGPGPADPGSIWKSRFHWWVQVSASVFLVSVPVDSFVIFKIQMSQMSGIALLFLIECVCSLKTKRRVTEFCFSVAWVVEELGFMPRRQKRRLHSLWLPWPRPLSPQSIDVFLLLCLPSQRRRSTTWRVSWRSMASRCPPSARLAESWPMSCLWTRLHVRGARVSWGEGGTCSWLMLS